jgi:hypothetical protein
MAWCLLPHLAEKLKSLNPKELAELSPDKRRQRLSEIVGEENAANVNAHFESRTLLKNQKLAMENWVKKWLKGPPEVKKDMISRIQKLDRRILDPKNKQAFLEDLASKKVGAKVSYEEVKKITELSKNLDDAKAKVADNSPIRSKERLEYGTAYALFKRYVKELKVSGEKLTFREYITNPKEIIYSTLGATKSILSSLDNSFFGRQGIKLLYRDPVMWSKAFAKSWLDIGKELVGKDAMLAIEADIYSRPNAMNNTYTKARLDIGMGEEAYPSSLPTKIPVLGRAFKASESAYNGGALRLRADYFDKILKVAEKNGIDSKNVTELRGIGQLVNSMTGRGSLGSLETAGKWANIALFSAKFLKSNFDFLTAHQFDPGMTKFAKQQAAKNVLRVVGTIGSVLTIAEMLNPGSVEKDPRSSNFGKIKIGNVRIDITGGMAGLVTLASRLIPMGVGKEGDLQFFEKNKEGKVVRLGAKYGGRDAMDVFWDFFEGKFSPLMGAVRDTWKGRYYSGETATPLKTVGKMFTPIPIQKYEDLKDPSSADSLLQMIAETIGFGARVDE